MCHRGGGEATAKGGCHGGGGEATARRGCQQVGGEATARRGHQKGGGETVANRQYHQEREKTGESVIEEVGRPMSAEIVTKEEERLLPSTAGILTGLVLEVICKDCDCVVLVRLSQTGSRG